MTTSHPRDRFKGKDKQSVERNFVALINNWPFDSGDFLNKSLSLNLKTNK